MNLSVLQRRVFIFIFYLLCVMRTNTIFMVEKIYLLRSSTLRWRFPGCKFYLFCNRGGGVE